MFPEMSMIYILLFLLGMGLAGLVGLLLYSLRLGFRIEELERLGKEDC